MPGFDKSGPMGAGAMSGGGRGFCNTTDWPDANAFGAGYGLGRGCRLGRFFAGGAGRGPGRGFGREERAGTAPMRPVSPPDEMAYLSREARNLEKNLQMIQKRIDDLQPKIK